MPIIDVEIVEDAGAGDTSAGNARALADSLAEVLGTGPAETWVRVRKLAREAYAENGAALGSDVRPTFVTVLRARLPEPDVLREDARRIARAVAQVLARPERNVHVVFSPPAAGRVAFGGILA